MNDSDRLDRTLAKLAAAGRPPAAGGRWIGTQATGPADLLVALLTECDETVLARRLVFTPEGTDAFAIEVYGRRLLSFSHLPSGIAGADLAGLPLADLDPADWQRVVDLLQELLGGARRLAVRSQVPDGRRDATQLGIAATALAESLGLELGLAPAPEPAAALDRLLEQGSTVATAVLRLAGEDETVGLGKDDAVARLKRFSESGLKGLRAGATTDRDEPTCITLGTSAADALQLVVALSGQHALLMLVPGHAVGNLLSAWQTSFQ